MAAGLRRSVLGGIDLFPSEVASTGILCLGLTRATTKSLPARGTTLIVLALITSGILLGCSKTLSFQEEVEIARGKVILITQTRELQRACEGFICGWKTKKFRLSDGKAIPVEWVGTMVPMLLLSLDGHLVLVARDRYCEGPPYQQFVLLENRWETRPLHASLRGKDGNLALGDPTEDWFGSARPLTIEHKRTLAQQPGFPKHNLRIIPDAPRNC